MGTKTMSAFDRLKRTAGTRKMSRLTSEPPDDTLKSSHRALYEEYLAASKDKRRLAALRDWDVLDSTR